jgi:flagellar biosynthesis/type III secretory pathway protein FliH
LTAGKRWAELEASQNPFAVVVMAHLDALRTRRDGLARREAKLTLVRELHRRGYEAKDVRQLFRFIDWMMTLPEELEPQFWTRLHALEEEKRMPYITSIERIGHQRGLEEGRKEGLEEGLKEGMREGIRMDLKLRFGAEGLALMPEVQALQDEALLRRILEALIRGSSLEEVRQIWRG